MTNLQDRINQVFSQSVYDRAICIEDDYNNYEAAFDYETVESTQAFWLEEEIDDCGECLMNF